MVHYTSVGWLSVINIIRNVCVCAYIPYYLFYLFPEIVFFQMSLQFNDHLIGKHWENDRRSLTSKNSSGCHQNRDLFIGSIFRSRFISRINDIGYDTLQGRIILILTYLYVAWLYLQIYILVTRYRIAHLFPEVSSWRESMCRKILGTLLASSSIDFSIDYAFDSRWTLSFLYKKDLGCWFSLFFGLSLRRVPKT